MGSRLKEEDRNERTIRALLKQPENRRCINCGSLGPQYVCTTFSIFVCTNCSGLHREFSHRIKSVSMAKFAAEEVRNLQAGGNERARELFLKDYDLQRNPLPESSNPDKLRDFIKTVYVERRYTGERAPPKGRQGDGEDSYDARQDSQQDPRSGGRSPRGDFNSNMRSPPYEDRHDDRQFGDRRRSDSDRGREDDRKPDDRFARFEGRKKNTGKFNGDRSRFDLKSQSENRRHEDRSRYDERERRASYDDLFANEIRHDRRSSADDRMNMKEFDGDSPPVRPVTEILGDNVPALWVEEFRQTNGRDDDERSSLGSPLSAEHSRDGRLSKHGSFGVTNGSTNVSTSLVVKRVYSGSLIDFSAETVATEAAFTAADPFGVSTGVVPLSTTQTTTSDSNTGWATFDTAPAGTAAAPTEGPPAGYPDVYLAQSKSGQWAASAWAVGQRSSVPASEDWSSLVGSSVQQPSLPSGSETLQTMQSWSSFTLAGKDSASHLNMTPMDSELLPKSKLPSVSAVGHGVDTSRELPQELFAHAFPSAAMSTGGFPMGPQIPRFAPAAAPFGPGFLPTYVQPPRSRNPFDLPGETSPSTGLATFPSMGSLQAALPNGHMPLTGSVAPTSSSNQWSMGMQPPYALGGTAGGSNLSAQHDGANPPVLAQSSGLSLGLTESGSFNNRSFLASDQSFGGQGSSEFSTQNYVRSVSGNPFG